MVLELFNIQSEGAEYTDVNYPAEIGLKHFLLINIHQYVPNETAHIVTLF